jgi:hypothetical protein
MIIYASLRFILSYEKKQKRLNEKKIKNWEKNNDENQRKSTHYFK